MSEMESNSSSEPASSSSPKHYKAIIAIGVIGEEEVVEEFVALWIHDAERRAHRIVDKLFDGRVTLLPLPEETNAETEG